MTENTSLKIYLFFPINSLAPTPIKQKHEITNCDNLKISLVTIIENMTRKF